ncbi:hypothetical protein TanjilG_17028 [Lupinus angustifolius]|uniref:agamous-like MADS-box protein AGL80 n=1 Tax=Lupinus angustifolius TaxID=3871 RepID=UPI00090D7336|nr:PREDICTED: agamous-like MADS-box protein AGL80 [Lupinus angustifolius]OIV91068.1 hypothetical protein TanjilG_17028 [Lupinus angustifolius]
MTRKKVTLAYITDQSARKATFKKRQKGIMKKVSELTTLCGIQACAMIWNPFDAQTEVWPDPEGAKQLIKRYQETSLKDETKNLNQESFTRQRITKAKDQLNKLRKENREKGTAQAIMHYIQTRKLPQNPTITDLKDMDTLVEKYLTDINSKMAALGS